MAFAGVTHLLRPDPFVQHLPDWVPGRDLLVALTGVIEIALGIALVAPRHIRPAAGRAVAAYLVAVFPANVYVAVADVDIDGQPGGVWRWIRLPLQAVFVTWALWSTSRRAGTPTAPSSPPVPVRPDPHHADAVRPTEAPPWNPPRCFPPSPCCRSSPSSPAAGRSSGSSPPAVAPSTPNRERAFRAGHAHAGVLLVVALAGFAHLDRTTLGTTSQWLLGATLLGGILAQSGGFFVHLVLGAPARHTAGTRLTRIGAVLIAVALTWLAIAVLVAAEVAPTTGRGDAPL